MKPEEFKNLSEQEQWNWVIRNADSVRVILLDNDSTYISLKEWDDAEAAFEAWLGNGPGIRLLLNALGIENDGV